MWLILLLQILNYECSREGTKNSKKADRKDWRKAKREEKESNNFNDDEENCRSLLERRLKEMRSVHDEERKKEREGGGEREWGRKKLEEHGANPCEEIFLPSGTYYKGTERNEDRRCTIEETSVWSKKEAEREEAELVGKKGIRIVDKQNVKQIVMKICCSRSFTSYPNVCLPEMPANAREWMKWIEFPSRSSELSEWRSMKQLAGISSIKLSLRFSVSIVLDAEIP